MKVVRFGSGEIKLWYCDKWHITMYVSKKCQKQVQIKWKLITAFSKFSEYESNLKNDILYTVEADNEILKLTETIYKSIIPPNNWE